MKTFIAILILSVALIAICGILFAVKIIFKKNGQFQHTCAFDWQENKCRQCNGQCNECSLKIHGK